MGKVRVAIFDLDGTLLVGTKSVMPDLAAVFWRRGYRRWRGAPLLLIAGVVGLVRKLRLISTEGYTRLGTRLIALWMGGDQVENLAPYFEETVGKQSVRPETLAALRRHQAEGTTCLVVSAVVQPLLDRFGEQFGCTALGTPLGVTPGGRLTGRLAGPFCSGAGKAEAVTRWAKGFEVDWMRSWAYGDTLPDAAVLALVGHGVAVAPDALLRAEAERQGWQIMA
jgi:HAD superfamily hydrolase (TIGR01490 family)